MDDDADLDIVASFFSDNEIAWFENDGAESFTRNAIITAAEGVRDVTVADVDGDTHLDIVYASVNDNTVGWLENDGQADPAGDGSQEQRPITFPIRELQTVSSPARLRSGWALPVPA